MIRLINEFSVTIINITNVLRYRIFVNINHDLLTIHMYYFDIMDNDDIY